MERELIQECPVCTSGKIIHFRSISREGIVLDLARCRNCSHVFRTNLSDTDIYKDGTFTQIARHESKIPSKEKIKSLDEKAFDRYRFYFALLRDKRNVLEIGSSIGSFLSLLKFKGADIQGIEPDVDYAGFSEVQYHFKQESILFEEYKTTKNFDLICNFHVIEHVRDPRFFIRKSWELLQEKGRILIECPSWEVKSYGSVKQTLWSPHIHYFSLKSIYHLLSPYFHIDNYGYYGSALYVSGTRKSLNQGKTNSGIPSKLAIIRAYASLLVYAIPPLFKKNETLTVIRQVLLQFLLNRKRAGIIFNKGRKYAGYKISEHKFLKKETGKGEKKISHVTNYRGFGNNSGDVVLSKCVRDVIREGKRISFNIIDLKREVDTALIDSINKTSALVIGGGGLFLPDTNQNAISGWQWAVSKDLLDRISRPVILYAIGYNYFRGQEPNELFLKNLGNILEKASFTGIRNYGSIDRLNELTNNRFKESIVYQPCPTTLISKYYSEFYNLREKEKSIAVNIAFDRYTIRFGSKIYAILDEIVSSLKELNKAGYKIFNVSHISADERFEAALDKYDIPYQTVRLQHFFPQQVYRFYSRMSLVIGMRGHAQMIPFGVNSPILSLGTHDKMKWFLDDIESSDWYIDLNRNTDQIGKSIVETSMSILSNSDQITDRLITKQDELYRITQRNLKEIKSLI